MSSLDYRQLSYWLMTAEEDIVPRPSVQKSIEVDVAILGAGFTGLWTAYYLLRKDPSLRVAVLEEHVAGYGASGRNGGWCTAEFPVSHERMAKLFGNVEARAMQSELFDTVNEIEQICSNEGIDCEWEKSGALTVAIGSEQVASAQNAVREAEALGLGDHFHLLSEEQVKQHVLIRGALAAVYNPDCASIHPGKLVRGLARVVEQRGGLIFEQSRVINIDTGSRPALVTQTGQMIKAQTVVLAGEAFLSRFTRFRRRILPLRSSIILTECLTAEQWEEIGWRRRMGLASFRYTVNYLNQTQDGRILFGGRGAPYQLGSHINVGSAVQSSTVASLTAQLHAWFPTLKDIGISHSWEGVLGMPRDWLPNFSYDPGAGIAWAYGYTGQGVAMSNLAGRILSELIVARGSLDELSTSFKPLINRTPRLWEREPMRFLGVRYTQHSLTTLDSQAERTGVAPSGRSIAERLSRH